MRSCETGSVRMSVLLKCDDVNTLNGIEWYGSSPFKRVIGFDCLFILIWFLICEVQPGSLGK
jgi:hypothetical protein